MNGKKNENGGGLSGKGKGEEGEVRCVHPEAGKVVVEGVSVATRHQKARRQGEEGGIVKKETPIYACKVMTVCPKCNKATRVAHKIVDGKKVRVCKHCGAEI